MKWLYRSLEDPLAEALETIRKRVGHKVVADILYKRGYKEKHQETESFLSPHRDQLHDPFIMKGMYTAVERLEQAISQGERIRIYGDYDVDGVCSVALFCLVLGKYVNQGLLLDYYIPDRHKEGYGISLAAIEDSDRKGVQLIVALDCGSSDLRAARLAKEKGIDLIICDHHVLGKELPNCRSLLNPKQADCLYPQEELSAAAVGFKLLQGLSQKGIIEDDVVWSCIDLVALSLVADQVPLLGENRVLLCEGIDKMRKAPNLGLSVLIEKLGASPREVSSEMIAFRLAPPLNAAGRMAHARDAVELLLSSSKDSAIRASELLFDLNLRRKEAQERATEEALAQLSTEEANQNTSFLYQKDWHPGVIGIVAARCMDVYSRPTLVFTQVGDHIVGSMRSTDAVHARDTLEASKDLLLRFGGHRYAAGCSLAPDQLPRLREVVGEYVDAQVRSLDLRPVLCIDHSLSPLEIDPQLYDALQQLAPYGRGNPVPVFCATSLRAIPGSLQLLRDKHLRFQLAGPAGHLWTVIGFGMGAKADALSQGLPFHMAYTIEENIFRGHSKLQLHLKDLIFD